MEIRFVHFTQSDRMLTLVDCDVTYVYEYLQQQLKNIYTCIVFFLMVGCDSFRSRLVLYSLQITNIF